MALTTFAGTSSMRTPQLEERVRIQALAKLGVAQLLNEDSGTAIGGKAGETRKKPFLDQLPEPDASSLAETEPIDRGAPRSYSDTYLLEEFGFAIDFTGLSEELNEIELEDKYVQLLSDHFAKKKNYIAYSKAVQTAWTYRFAGTNEFRTDSTFSAVNTEDLTRDNLHELASEAEERNIPTYDGENYVYVTRPTAVNRLGSSTDVFESMSNQYPKAALNGEVGMIARCRLVKDNQKTGPSSFMFRNATVGFEGLFFGGDALLEEVAVPLKISYDSENHGRFLSVAYRWIAGYDRVYKQSVTRTEHIIHVGDTLTPKP